MVKLISVIYRLRNIIKNYMKYRTNIIYDRYFIKVISEFIIYVCEKAYYYRPIENLLLEFYPRMIPTPCYATMYDDEEPLIKNLQIPNINMVNSFINKINDFMYNDKELTEHQKDKLNYVIHKNFIR